VVRAGAVPGSEPTKQDDKEANNDDQRDKGGDASKAFWRHDVISFPLWNQA
jgi:hypothetical protein